MTPDELEATGATWGDDRLVDVIQEPERWDSPTRGGSLVHESGCRIEITGASGRFVAVTARDQALRGDGGGIRYFGSYSSAIEALREANKL